MTHPWELEGFERRIQFVGWPEWEGAARTRFRLFQQDRQWVRQTRAAGSHWSFSSRRTDHEAACLLREWFRVWLEKHRVQIIFDRPGLNYVERQDGKALRHCDGDSGWDRSRGRIWLFDTYDAAQAAAIDAVIAEEKEKA